MRRERTAAGLCGAGARLGGCLDFTGRAGDGCEVDSAVVPSCACTPGATQPCYTGPAGTQGKGVCKAGVQTCDASGLLWGPCLNPVVPSTEVCANGVDEDGSGVDDADGDGGTKLNGDCREKPPDCSAPPRVSPDAFDLAGHGVDDHRDGTTDGALRGRDAEPANLSSSGFDGARAVDLRHTTRESAPPAQKKWGVVSATFSLANGAGAPWAEAGSIRQGSGSDVSPARAPPSSSGRGWTS